MATDWSALDHEDPCALLTALQPKYMALMAGEAEAEVEIDGRRVKFAQTSLPRLEKLINKLRGECMAKQQNMQKRRALGARHYR